YYDRGLAYFVQRNYDRAVSDFSEAIRLDPRKADAYGPRGAAHAQKKEYARAISDCTEAVFLDPADSLHMALLASLLASCPQDSLRDGKRAVEIATRACELSGWKDTSALDALAAACAECGAFKEAIRWQKRTLELGGANPEALLKARVRLAL